MPAGKQIVRPGCPAPGGEQVVLDLAAVLLVAPLPRTRALWAATLVTGVARHQAALIVVFHHVLADGVAGLVVLGGLVDQSDATGTPRAVGPKTHESDFPRPQASIRQLAIDAWTRRLGSLRALPALLRRLQDAARELRSVRWTRLRPTSLNRPTGPRRGLATVTVALDGIRNAGHAQKATVNDVVLTAIGGALPNSPATGQGPARRFY
ncbi:wax ester/triacylglycerol synthase domain-containing protein [Cryobacterium sp. TMT2-4]|uniref:wax ester/triacylglycerol synthase domain-containing protein n=1 Tax=Cryobacterium sp. TMT2-4 TaxID=1259254 RepID=UPI0021058856|nr:wax ester/triacylglycerol synthase domain-containing protein [Cryobacterium sp. TMT2-4]